MKYRDADEWMAQRIHRRRIVRAASPAIVTPDQLGTLRFQFKASTHAGLANGTALTTWTGSVSGVNASQATANRRPTKQTVNGRPVIRFDGVNDVMETTLNQVTKSTTYVKYAARANTNGSFFGANSTNNYVATGGTPIQRNTTVFPTDANFFAFSGGATLNASKRFVLTFDYDNDQYAAYLDGVARGTHAAAHAPDLGASIFIMLGVGYGEFLSADIEEIGQFNSVLDASALASLDSYLTATYP